jgi:hypothetical protein
MADYVVIAGKTVINANTDFFGRNTTLTGMITVGNTIINQSGLNTQYAFIKALDANTMTVSTSLFIGNSSVNLSLSPTGMSTLGSLTVSATTINGTLNVSGTTTLQTLNSGFINSAGENIVSGGDASLYLETTLAPATTYRRKVILSSVNVGGGTDWLFRSTRPSDGAIRDVQFTSTGSVWMTGNFDPNLKFDKVGGTISGAAAVLGNLTVGAGTANNLGRLVFQNGSAVNTGYMEFWNATATAREGYIGYAGADGIIQMSAERAGGYFNFNGGIPRIGNQQIWYAGNFDPNTKMDKAGGIFTGNVQVNTNLFIPSAAGGTVGFAAGTGDGASLSTYNHKLNIWFGLGLGDYSGTVRGVYDARNGVWNTTGVPQVNGQNVWYPGNFNPANYAPLTGATFSGDITTHRNNTSGVIFLGNTGARYLFYDGTNYIMPGTNLVVNGGTVWHTGNFDPNTKATVGGTSVVRFGAIQIGDTEGYIYSDSASNNIRFRAGTSSGGYKYAGFSPDGVFTNFSGGFSSAGTITTPSLTVNGDMTVGGGQNNSRINFTDTDEGTRAVHNNSGSIGFLGSDAGWKLRSYNDGSVWTAQFGDLNNRIEDRASAWAGGRVAKTGDTMTGTLRVSMNNPSIQLFYGGVYNWQLWGGNDAVFRISNGDGGGDRFKVGSDGSLWCSQLGDINSRIEQRAQDWANTRQANLGFTPVKQGYNGNQLTMGWTGGGVNMNVDNGGFDGGRIFCQNQDGGLINDIRWVYVGDHEANEYTALDGYHEPSGGAAVTGFKTNQLQTQINGSIYAYLYAFRLRCLQKRDNYGNWYNSYYV